ncbi:PAS domain-containing sensor histidine kinase [Pantanalinema sp. GBBB05]|uniref:PAS domain-containing sensor histidine kinase n=1 Tax=Pantanalinema sp. GBBB05 TaxID=2604139 RepID=UPI001D57E3A9|nr:PAS domain S-box protein [Pantanalinema sp. GBBB05]
MATEQITLDREVYAAINQELVSLRQRVIELEQAEHDRQKTAAALAESERRFRQTVANIPGAIYQFTNRDGVWSVNYISEQIWNIAGITAEAMMADLNHFIDRLHPDDLVGFVTSTSESVENTAAWQYEGRLIQPNGELRWWQGSSTPSVTETGEVIFYGVILDITSRKQAEEALWQLNDDLEARIEERTAELLQAIEQLELEAKERREAEVTLSKSERRFQKLAANVPGMIYQFQMNPDGSIVVPYLSSGCRDIYEIEPEMLQQDPNLMIRAVHPDERQQFLDSISLSAQTLQTWRWEGRIITDQGQTKWLQAVSRPEVKPNGGILWDGLLIDVTDRRQAEQALGESQAQLELFFSQSLEGFFFMQIDQPVYWDDLVDQQEVLDYVLAHLQITRVNHALLSQYGASQDEFIGRSFAELFANSTVQARTACRRLLDNKHLHLETQTRKLDDTPIWIEGDFLGVYDRDDRLTGIFGVQRDITDRKQAEAKLQQTQQFLSSVLNNLPVAVLAKEAKELRFALLNPAATALFGLAPEAVLDRNDYDLFPQEQADLFTQIDRDVLSSHQILDIPEEEVKIKGEIRILHTKKTAIVDETGEPEYLLIITEDITERKQAEAALRQSEAQLRQQTAELEQTLRELQRTQSQLIQSEKMSSLGQLVAGVAHEINNPVNFIYGNLAHANNYIQDLLGLVQLYRTHYSEPVPEIADEATEIDLEFLMADLPKLLNSMKIGAERIQKIVLSLRNFSRMDEAEMKAVNIHEGIDSTLMILQNRLKAKPEHPAVKIIKEYGKLPLVECYAGQLNQVFMNILSNAIDALEERDRHRSWEQIEEYPSVILITTEYLSQERVVIRISDNGPGMSRQTQQRLFDPFFTTKPVGQGTGLGMSISYQIITDRHRGRLQCISSPGQGAEFVIEIPIKQNLLY